MMTVDAEIGRLVSSEHGLSVSVDRDLGVRVRIYAADGLTVLADLAATALYALAIAALFHKAALLADPSLAAPFPTDIAE